MHDVTPSSPQDRPWRLAVLISGSGRTLHNLIECTRTGTLPAEIVAVVSSIDHVRGIEIASDAGIPVTVIERKHYRSVRDYSIAVREWLEPYAPDLLIMAGFLRQLTILPGWDDRILNIHPSLLPEAASYAAGKGMYGDRVHAAVLDHGDQRSGATVHVVNANYDEGPPLDRAEVPILREDTVRSLADRVFEAELTLYPQTIATYMQSRPDLKRSPQNENEHTRE